MSAVPFDTLKFARHLEASGLTASAAAGAAEALSDALTGSDLATRGDLVTLRTDLTGEITSVRADLTNAIAGVRTDLTNAIAIVRTDLTKEIGGVRTDLSAEIAELRADLHATKTELKNDIELLRRDITIKFGSMMVIAVGILLAAIRYLPPHS